MKLGGPKRKVKVMIVVGTRPEAIKMAPVIQEFQARQESSDLTIVNTAQHRQLVDEVFSLYGIVPSVDLNIMEDNQTLGLIFSKTSEAIDRVLQEHRPDILLIQGDTSTVFVAALMAFYHKIDVGHVEAGLRTSDMYNPFPEEINRRMTSELTTLHFAPTQRAKRNLLREGHRETTIFVTGNPVIDALLKAVQIQFECQNELLNSINDGCQKLVLITAQRRENHGKPLADICQAILELSELHENVVFVYPVHPNPNVKRPVEEVLSARERVFLVDPLDYMTFVHLMKKSYLILTDSGGVQEEAPTIGKPVLVLRETTERPEAVEVGAARIVGTERRRIVREVTSLLKNGEEYEKMVVSENPFGDGKASRRIADIVLARYAAAGD